jgi:hypothetical protein
MLAAEDRGWHELQARLSSIGPDDWEKPGAAGDWCAKDVVAHISCWHAQLTDWLEAWRARGEKPGEIDFQAFNDRFYEESKDLTLHDARVMSGASRHRIREELALLDSSTMKEGWWRLIETCLQGHYDEHIPDLDVFLGRNA